MSRPLRIEYPNAWYHVMNRGRRAEKIFTDEKDYAMFVQILQEVSVAWNIRISAYCLMPNHYHLLLQTPEANIARSMRHINGVYTQRFNRRHGFDGPLFRGRYKSILIDADSYLLQLVRYVHRNPFKAGICTMDKYEWSSHKGYLSVAKKWDWIYKTFVFQLLSNDKKLWVRRYRLFVQQETDKGFTRTIESTKWPSMLGAKAFTDWVKGKYYSRKDNSEITQIKELAPEPEKIISAVCDSYSVTPEALSMSKRGTYNEPRNVAIFLFRRVRRDSLENIGVWFQIQKYSSVSSAVERLKAKMAVDSRLKHRVDGLITLLIKSQKQT